MGCFPAKIKKFESKTIDCDFSATYTLKMDQFFDDVKDCLKIVEQLRSEIEDSRDNLLRDTYAIYLKSPSLKEALRIMFWCISANHEGHIQEAKPIFQDTAPYLTMELKADTKMEVTSLWRYFTTYLHTVKEGPQLIAEELEKYEKYLEEANGFVNNGVEDALSVHQTPIQKAQAALNISRNITKMQDQAGAVRRVKDLIEDAKKEAEKITDFLEDLVKSADEVGERAYKQGWLAPEEVCLHCHPQLTKGVGDAELRGSRNEFFKTPK